MWKNRRLADRVKPLELPRRRDVNPLDQQVEAEQREDGDQEQGRRWADDDDDGDGFHETPDEISELVKSEESINNF